LDDIISSKKSHLYKSKLGYNQIERGSRSKTTEKETNPKSYAETIKEDRKIYKEYYKDTPPPRIFRFQNQQQTNRPQEEEGFIRDNQEDLQIPGIKLYFLVYVMYVIVLDIKL
jgi:hypothetical protein